MGLFSLASWHARFAGRARVYSAERLYALDEYCKSTSYIRVLLVLLLFPAPALLIMLILDAVPLRDLSAGWSADPSLCMREFVCCLASVWIILLEAELVVPGLKISSVGKVVVATAVGLVRTAAMMLIAQLWAFPIPFTLVTCAPLLGLFLNILVVVTIGFQDRNVLTSYLKFSNFIGLQMTMLIVYPTYNAAFLSLSGRLQLVFVLLLPGIKLGFKLLIAKLQPDDDDFVPGLQSSVDIFDALYMTKCMQSAGALLVGAGIIAIDVAQNYVAHHFLTKQSKTLRAVIVYGGRMATQGHTNLLPLVFGLLSKSQRLPIDSLRFVSQRLLVSTESAAQLVRLRSIQDVANLIERAPVLHKKAVLPQSLSEVGPVMHKKSVSPQQTAKVAPTTSEQTQRDIGSPSAEALIMTEAAIFRETTRLLHESEAVVVVEYIETVVPVLYAVYILILAHLPNAKYYADMESMTPAKLHQTVINILIYAIFELLSLVHVAHLLKRSFSVSVFYQLAFALESDWRIYQCSFVSWILLIFNFLLVHYGSDFTFKFAWMHAGAETP